MQVTISLEFDVTVPVKATTREEAEAEVENMSLTEYFDWATCASYNMNILEVHDE
jgi:hypothetical protein